MSAGAMRVKSVSLPVVFAGALVLFAALLFGYETIRVDSFLERLEASPESLVYFAMATVMSAGAVAFVVGLIREVRRARRPEMAGYRRALKTGHVSGDVGPWPDWIRHDRRVNAFWVWAAAFYVFVLVMAVVSANWGEACVAVWMGLLSGGLYWRTRTRVNAVESAIRAR